VPWNAVTVSMSVEILFCYSAISAIFSTIQYRGHIITAINIRCVQRECLLQQLNIPRTMETRSFLASICSEPTTISVAKNAGPPAFSCSPTTDIHDGMTDVGARLPGSAIFFRVGPTVRVPSRLKRFPFRVNHGGPPPAFSSNRRNHQPFSTTRQATITISSSSFLAQFSRSRLIETSDLPK